MTKTIPADTWRSLHREWLWVYRGPVPKCGVWSAEISVPHGVFFVEHGEVRIRANGEEVIVPRGGAYFSAVGLRQHWFAQNTLLLSVGFRCTWPDGTPLYRTGLNLGAKQPKLRHATLELFRRVHRGKNLLATVKPSHLVLKRSWTGPLMKRLLPRGSPFISNRCNSLA